MKHLEKQSPLDELEPEWQTKSIPFRGIIDRLRYDTEKCTLVYDQIRDLYVKGNRYVTGFGVCPMGYKKQGNVVMASLWKTPNSRFFLLNGDGRVGSESWFPMSLEDALEWAETEMPMEDFEAAFADCVEDA